MVTYQFHPKRVNLISKILQPKKGTCKFHLEKIQIKKDHCIYQVVIETHRHTVVFACEIKTPINTIFDLLFIYSFITHNFQNFRN